MSVVLVLGFCGPAQQGGTKERCPSWPKEHDWKSCIRQKRIWGSNPHLSARRMHHEGNPSVMMGRCLERAPSFRQRRPHPMRRGGRVVECGGLENRFTGNPGDEGSNPSSSAIKKGLHAGIAWWHTPSDPFARHTGRFPRRTGPATA